MAEIRNDMLLGDINEGLRQELDRHGGQVS